MTTRLRPLLLLGVPILVLSALVLNAVWGDEGWVERQRLRAEVSKATGELADLERENQRMLRELSLLERDPLIVERETARVLGQATPGTVVVTFEDESEAR